MEPSKCRKECIEEECGTSDAETVLLVKRLLDLTDVEAQVLGNVLSDLKDDPLLVLQVNSNWIPNGGANADTVLDAIAVHDMPVAPSGAPQERRDKLVGCSRWIFQLKNTSDVVQCKMAIQALHLNAFAFTPTAAAQFAVIFPLNPPLPAQSTQPLAEAVVINKAITSSDAMSFPFFYFQ